MVDNIQSEQPEQDIQPVYSGYGAGTPAGAGDGADYPESQDTDDAD